LKRYATINDGTINIPIDCIICRNFKKGKFSSFIPEVEPNTDEIPSMPKKGIEMTVPIIIETSSDKRATKATIPNFEMG
jgi:hypothetical protein